jgi:hypothetical protein
VTLRRVAASPTFIINGVAVSPECRIFVCCPRWNETPSPNVAEVLQDGTFRAYPNDEWTSWTPEKSTHDRFVSAHSIHCDADNQLWVVDDAVVRQLPDLHVRPKLVRIDLSTNAVAEVITFDESVAPLGAHFGHLRAEGGFIYVTDAKDGALIVHNRATGVARRLLAGHPAVQVDPSILPYIDGKPFRQKSGAPIEVAIDLLEISGSDLYFTCLFGPTLWRVPLAALQDEALTAAELGAQVKAVVDVPPCAGLMGAADGTIYLSAFTRNAILRLRRNLELDTLVEDARISFPNEGTVGPDGFLYFPASQIHRIPSNQPDGVSKLQLPFEVLKVDVRS